MRFLTNIFPIIAGLAGVAVAADANSVNAQLGVISSYLTALNNDVQRVAAGIDGVPYALQVQQDAVIIHKEILKGTKEAKASPPFGEPGSITISTTVIMLSDTVSTTLQNVAAKNSNFAELAPIVLASLYQLRQDTQDLGDAIVEKLADLEKAVAPVVIGQLKSSFNTAIVAYGGKAN